MKKKNHTTVVVSRALNHCPQVIQSHQTSGICFPWDYTYNSTKAVNIMTFYFIGASIFTGDKHFHLNSFSQ